MISTSARGPHMRRLTDEGLALERAVVVGIHFDPRRLAVDIVRYEAIPFECLEDVVECGIVGHAGDVDGRIDTLGGLFL